MDTNKLNKQIFVKQINNIKIKSNYLKQMKKGIQRIGFKEERFVAIEVTSEEQFTLQKPLRQTKKENDKQMSKNEAMLENEKRAEKVERS